MIVYLITNKINGKKYVGKTSRDLELRWKEHQRAASKEDPDFYIARSIRYHGVENFTVEVVEECVSEKALAEAEIAWIAELGTHGPGGYNLTDGGEGPLGKVTSDATKKLLSDIAKARPPFTEEHRRKISIANSGENNAFYGKAWGRTGPLSEETKEKLSIAHTGKTLSESHKSNISKGCKGKPGPNKGRKFEEASCYKMSLSRSRPVDVLYDSEHIFTCFSLDDTCALFKPSNVSGREMSRVVKSDGTVGLFSFIRHEENIANLKLKISQKG